MDWGAFINYFEKNDHSPVLLPLIKRVDFVSFDGKECVLGCENLGTKLFLDSKRTHIEKYLGDFFGQPLSVVFSVVPKKRSKKQVETANTEEPLPIIQYQNRREEVLKRSGLQARFTFENFAVSSTNQIAHAAAMAVAGSPGSVYNPLFIYGSVGVGKTHLSHAVANKIISDDDQKRVLFCSSEQFTNDLIEHIRSKSTKEFRSKYRSIDVLIVDDVQFIAGKNAVQEEFYHTFNTIVQNGGQIILTSDRPPREIAALEDRLRSRFVGGLIIDMQRPGLELRTAIVLIKANERNIEIDVEAARAIAERVNDTRELEGALLRLLSLSLNQNTESSKITTEAAQGEFFKQREEALKKTTPHEIIRTVCAYYGTTPTNIKGSSRKEDVVLPRQVAMYLLRKLLEIKLDEIAFILKRKDHTTIIHGVDKITKRMLRDEPFRREIDALVGSLL